MDKVAPPVSGTTDFRWYASTAYKNTEQISQTRKITADSGRKGASMTTKRLKKLLMAKGLSRNQVNRMVDEQRDSGSKKVSNDLYYHVFMHNFDIITSSFGGEVLPYLNSFVLN